MFLALLTVITAITTAVAAIADVTLDAWLVTAIVGFLSPIVVGLLTKLHASTKIKRIVAAVCAAVVAYVVERTLSDGTAVISLSSLGLLVVTIVAQQTGYAQVWRYIQLNAKMVPRFGFGRDAT